MKCLTFICYNERNLKKVVFIRHAKSSWDNPSLADYHRPVAKRGLRDIELVGNYLRSGKEFPDFVISSGALRAHTTACGICKILGFDGPIETSTQLYFEGSDAIINQIRGLDEKHSVVFMFSHNPDLNELCIGQLGLTVENVPTTGVVFTESLAETWREWMPQNAEIKGFLRPKDLLK